MANLTITIDDELLKRARLKALEQGTSVNAILRRHLETFVGKESREEAWARFLELARNSKSGSGPGGRKWKREDLYDRKGLR
jgi:hypothetical protein